MVSRVKPKIFKKLKDQWNLSVSLWEMKTYGIANPTIDTKNLRDFKIW